MAIDLITMLTHFSSSLILSGFWASMLGLFDEFTENLSQALNSAKLVSVDGSRLTPCLECSSQMAARSYDRA